MGRAKARVPHVQQRGLQHQPRPPPPSPRPLSRSNAAAFPAAQLYPRVATEDTGGKWKSPPWATRGPAGRAGTGQCAHLPGRTRRRLVVQAPPSPRCASRWDAGQSSGRTASPSGRGAVWARPQAEGTGADLCAQEGPETSLVREEPWGCGLYPQAWREALEGSVSPSHRPRPGPGQQVQQGRQHRGSTGASGMLGPAQEVWKGAPHSGFTCGSGRADTSPSWRVPRTGTSLDPTTPHHLATSLPGARRSLLPTRSPTEVAPEEHARWGRGAGRVRGRPSALQVFGD